MPVKIGREIVIHDDMVFQVGYGDPEYPINGMFRYDPVINDFEFRKQDTWVRLNQRYDPLYDMIRYNSDLKDFEFLVDGIWTARCDCNCPEPEPCADCPEPEPCTTPEPCAPCPGTIEIVPDIIREFLLCCNKRWNPYATGGSGVTRDNWDLSNTPDGSIIDFKFETFIIPDRFIVEYPVGTYIYDSGWRSTDPTHDLIDRELYPFGISTPGIDSVLAITITDSAYPVLRVTTFGSPNDLTEWRYSLNCTPTAED